MSQSLSLRASPLGTFSGWRSLLSRRSSHLQLLPEYSSEDRVPLSRSLWHVPHGPVGKGTVPRGGKELIGASEDPVGQASRKRLRVTPLTPSASSPVAPPVERGIPPRAAESSSRREG